VESTSKRANPGVRLAWIGAISIVVFLLHLGLGSTDFVSPWRVVQELFAGPGPQSPANDVVWAVRLPKALYCLLAGGILGIVGSAFQALFRNPLVEPFTIGVSSGAALGGALAQWMGMDVLLSYLGTPLFGFFGGLGSLLLVFGLSKRRSGSDPTTLLLAGVVVSSLLSAILSLVILLSGADSNRLMNWLLGSTSPQFMERVGLLAVLLVAGTMLLYRESRRLNAFAVSADTAQRLGIDPHRLKWRILIVGTAMAAAAVGTVGAIAFLGLVAPHIARKILGIDWRWSLPGSLLVGSGLLLASDVIAQRGIPWLSQTLAGKDMLATSLPVGVVTAILGAPSLLILLRRSD
jgi:iron complex transport system permease protein